MRATRADLVRVAAANPAARVELAANGELFVTPPTGGRSGQLNHELAMLIGSWAKLHGFIAFDSSTGFALPDSAIVSPDAALVPAKLWDSLSASEQDDFVPFAPTVALEIVSKTDRPHDLREKLLRMRAAGTAYVVLLDPYRGDVWTDGEPPHAWDVDIGGLVAVDRAAEG